MAPHSSTLAWKIPWTEEPGRLQSMGSLRVGHNCVTSLSLFTFMHWRRKWQPTPVFLPGESQGRGAWWAAVYGVAQSRTRLKRQQQQWKCQVLTTGFYFNSLIGPLGIKDQRRRVYTPKALDFLFNFSESIFFCLGFQKTLKLQAKLGACVCVCVCVCVCINL